VRAARGAGAGAAGTRIGGGRKRHRTGSAPASPKPSVAPSGVPVVHARAPRSALHRKTVRAQGVCGRRRRRPAEGLQAAQPLSLGERGQVDAARRSTCASSRASTARSTRAARDCLYPMIHSSDNDAARRCWRSSASRRSIGWARDAHMRDYEPGGGTWGFTEVSAADLARFFFHLDGLIPRRFDDYARWLLSGIEASESWGNPGGGAPGVPRLLQGRLAAGSGGPRQSGGSPGAPGHRLLAGGAEHARPVDALRRADDRRRHAAAARPRALARHGRNGEELGARPGAGGL